MHWQRFVDLIHREIANSIVTLQQLDARGFSRKQRGLLQQLKFSAELQNPVSLGRVERE